MIARAAGSAGFILRRIHCICSGATMLRLLKFWRIMDPPLQDPANPPCGLPKEGFEPSRGCPRQILSLLRLPFRHFGIIAQRDHPRARRR